ncbi:MAG: hypothetical protein U1F15_15410 [Burkholderiales bacterium]
MASFAQARPTEEFLSILGPCLSPHTVVQAPTPVLRRSIGLARDIGEGIDRRFSPAPPCVLGMPPRALAPLHDPYFVNVFWQRMLRTVANPAEVDTSLGHRRVLVLGVALYEFHADGTAEIAIWECPAGSPPRLTSIDPRNVTMNGTPYRHTWLDKFQDGFAYEHAQRFDASPEVRAAYVEWAWMILANRLRRHVDGRAMRGAIAEALSLDPWVRRMAHRLCRESGRTAFPSTHAAYNLIARHRADFAELERTTPNLIPLFGLLVERPDFPSDGEGAARLKSYLTSTHTLSQRLWRLVANGRPRLLAEFLPCYSSVASRSAIDLLSVLDRLGFRKMPPRWLLWNLLSYFADPGSRTPALARCPEFSSAAWRRIAVLAENGDKDTIESMRRDLHLVLAWLHEEGASLDGRTIRLAPWAWFVRSAYAWQRDVEARQRIEGRAWCVPLKQLHIGRFSVVGIDDGPSLLEEARAMHNCVDDYVGDCEGGLKIVYSIRVDGEDRSHAHALYEREDGGWTLVRVAGFANALPSPRAGVLAKVLETMLRSGYQPRGSRA